MSDLRAVGDGIAVELAAVNTLPELAEAFQRLRGSRSYTELDKAVNPNRRGQGPRTLPQSTLNNLLHGKSVPTWKTVTTFLTACGLDEDTQVEWLAAWERVSTAHLRRPVGAVRVREARPRLLGVHAAIQVAGAEGELPTYVPRDLDADLRTTMSAATEQGGFVLLVGGSSAGKTRALFESVKILPEWWLIHPDPADPGALHKLAAEPAPRTLVWLDELQRHLDTPDGLPSGLVRSLIASGIVLVGTLWPHEYAARTAAPIFDQPDRYANDRQLLGLATVIDVPDTFSAAEQRRAEALATDPRIRLALGSRDAGLTQVLTAGPELIRWWEQAATPYGRAIITAALDIRRVGVTAPLTRELLEKSSPGYLNSAQRATAPADWLDQALRYATTMLHGASSALIPMAAEIGQISGYAVADYLHQHARQSRRTEPLPAAAWRAIVEYHHPNETISLARSAESRGRMDEAEALYRTAEANSPSFNYLLTEFLAEQRRIDELLERDRLGDTGAAEHVTILLNEEGRFEEALEFLQVQHENGNRYAGLWLARLLHKESRTDEVQKRGDGRNVFSAARNVIAGWEDDPIVGLMMSLPESETPLSESDYYAKFQMPQRITPDTIADIAVINVLAGVEAGSVHAPRMLATLPVDEAVLAELRALSDAGNPNAGTLLVHLLAIHDRIDELASEVHAGTFAAFRRLNAVVVVRARYGRS